MTENPRRCACGCGEPTTLITKTDASRGAVKGEYRKWVRGHDKRKYPHGSTCAVAGCQRTPESNALCHAHFEWTRRNPGQTPTEVYLETDLERFEAKIMIVPAGHWIWTGSKTKSSSGTYYGYGTYEGRVEGAHRIAWKLFRGPIPDGYEVDHLCRKTLCTNPDHLQPTTHKINSSRGESPMAAKAAQTHCIHGHPFAGDNLIIRKNGTRECGTCARRRGREAQRRYRARKRAEALAVPSTS